jgi:hypothetical protein
LDCALLAHYETVAGLAFQVEKDYDHTTIADAVALITSIDQCNAKRSMKAT